MVLQHALVAFSVASILAPFSYYMGLGARCLKLPQITGYLISGIICGPYILGILSTESLLDLNIIEGACLSIIGLAAGAELDWGQLSRSKKQVLGITFAICIASWGFCYAAFEWLGGKFPILPEMDSKHHLAIATLGATLMMTRSPASAIAVLKEVEGKGPFCTLVMAVVMVKDVVVIVAFAFNLDIIRVGILPAVVGQSLRPIDILLPMLGVGMSTGVGACGGVLLNILLRNRPLLLLGGAGEAAQHRAKMIVVVIVSTFIFQLAHYFDAEPLLACVTMGMIYVNRRHERAEKDREEFHGLVSNIMSLSNVAFFGLIGASLKLSALKDMLWPALVVAAVRMVAIYVGSWLGCAATATTAEHRRLFWMSMVTQAGVAMGLARLAGTRFPDWGPHFQTFMMSIILVNLLVGPPLFRWALLRVGEGKTGSIAVLPSKESGSAQVVVDLPAATIHQQ